MAAEDEDDETEEQVDERRRRPGENLARAIEGGRRGDAKVRAQNDQRKWDKIVTGQLDARLATDGRAPSGRPQAEPTEEDPD